VSEEGQQRQRHVVFLERRVDLPLEQLAGLRHQRAPEAVAGGVRSATVRASAFPSRPAAGLLFSLREPS
jgi:hypothetical protein